MWLDDQPTALYRLFDDADELLYVGITHDIEERFNAHRVDKQWWPDVTRNAIEWHETRRAALAAELQAIRVEEPRYNIAGSPAAQAPRPLVDNEISVSQLRGNITEYIDRIRFVREAFVVVGRSRKRDRVAAVVPYAFYEQALRDRAALAALGEKRVPPPAP